jgi:hypothetical protein
MTNIAPGNPDGRSSAPLPALGVPARHRHTRETPRCCLAVTIAITPVITVIGWRWHQILARDLGLRTFALAALDVVLAATMSTDG